ncbi:hypothetical protein MYCTH_2113722 [Thermothelomyces thermophilus ATCC 42464]|uniref:Uncharacterized protein n=1 Tax=Thermothelomyces thermophilus (strain ATCC 42464 / BCRC 31852 / DSM 1799) TaxID=573729 RepID=G2QMX1_THET4|nr:uncharacterized protein MYCTH_2113722 [Thermothelomyces thermophilus ATCC 42464]AEO61844.1 hypothetical protein MYCTH_2113722 [Thermothelomyces thermophilus ATCC 42464]
MSPTQKIDQSRSRSDVEAAQSRGSPANEPGLPRDCAAQPMLIELRASAKLCVRSTIRHQVWLFIYPCSLDGRNRLEHAYARFSDLRFIGGCGAKLRDDEVYEESPGPTKFTRHQNLDQTCIQLLSEASSSDSRPVTFTGQDSEAENFGIITDIPGYFIFFKFFVFRILKLATDRGEEPGVLVKRFKVSDQDSGRSKSHSFFPNGILRILSHDYSRRLKDHD